MGKSLRQLGNRWIGYRMCFVEALLRISIFLKDRAQVASSRGRYSESPTVDIQSYVYSNAINKWVLKAHKIYESKTETNRTQENHVRGNPHKCRHSTPPAYTPPRTFSDIENRKTNPGLDQRNEYDETRTSLGPDASGVGIGGFDGRYPWERSMRTDPHEGTHGRSKTAS